MVLDVHDEDAALGPVPGFGIVFLTLLAVAAVLTPVLWPAPFRPVQVSICNESDIVLRHLRVSDVEFGDLAPGTCSSYRRLERVYSRLAFQFSAWTERQGWVPEDRLDERALPSGRYQFVVEGHSSSVQARLRAGVADNGVSSQR